VQFSSYNIYVLRFSEMAKKQYGDPIFTVRLDPETRARLEAAKGDRTLSDVARAALAQYLENQQQKTPAA